MERLSIYNGLFAIIGILFGLNALALFVTGEWGLPALLVAVGSVVMITGAVNELVSTDPPALEISSTELLVVFVGGCMILIGTVLEFRV
ncbi:hypothetical protein [Halostagnicola kamekurae]|uniref:Uncharacterized protein n=1 Tax=Halostagnicola kamekurae TaxID=619731 RepID=A0A1I6TEA9_9EURY|nr:hypothetical protein [Halostagnicola kamekurae]SFS87505.1 hypothetical protein SAMN04488556_3043 [Halostagnicola kamekurae]